MDIKIAELFKESRQNSKIRDAQLAMPTSRIPDLDWKLMFNSLNLCKNKSTHWNKPKKRNNQSHPPQQ